MVDIVFDAEVYAVIVVGCRVGVGLRIVLRGIVTGKQIGRAHV